MNGGKALKYKLTDEHLAGGAEIAAKPLWRRINLLDIIFVLAILAIAFLVASFFLPMPFIGIGNDQRMISYTIEIENVDGAMSDLLLIGDTAYDAAGKNDIGIVTSIKIEDTKRYRLDGEKGGLVSSSYPPDINGNIPKTLKITIEARADYKEGRGFTLSGNRISVGSPITLCFAGFTGTGTCVSLYEIYSSAEVVS